MDLLEMLQSCVGCVYISDIRLQHSYNKQAKYYLNKINLKEYSLQEINDAIKYVYNINYDFINFDSANDFIKDQLLL